MIQEYIDAESAVIYRQWQPQEIKQIAISILEILVYLQNQPQPVIHRDIKPENILIDEELKVYLVDFGFARMGGGEIAASSVVKGTMGFMSPEQMFNRSLTRSSDLYSLGATLICLLTGIKSADIGNLIDANYRIIFRHLVPPLERGWINWLEKITEPKYTDRYENAEAALSALQPLAVNRLPKLRISQTNLEFTSDQWGEKLTGIIQISNPIPETILFGQWEVSPHVSDPPHTPYDHSWISFSPDKFEGNNVECEITVDTSKLVENKIHKREIILHSNSTPEIETINVEVKTASVAKLEADADFILMIFFCRFLLTVFIFSGFNLLKLNLLKLDPLFMLIWCAVISLAVCALVNSINNKIVKHIIVFRVLSIITVVTYIMLGIIAAYGGGNLLYFSMLVTMLIITSKVSISPLFSEEKIFIAFLIIGLDFSLIITFKTFSEVIPQLDCLTLGEILDSAIVAIASLPATLIPLLYFILKPIKIFSEYRKAEPNLIKP